MTTTRVRPVRADPAVQGAKRARFLVAIIGVAAFGPYVVGGLRTEQIVVYGVFLLALPFVLPQIRVAGGLRFLVPWFLYVLLATLSVAFPSSEAQPYEFGSIAAGYDNILLPIAVMLLLWAVISVDNALPALRTFCKVIAVCAAANGAIAIIGLSVDLSDALRPFWTGGEGDTVANRAATMGRFGGVFNQPVEAGVMYGLAGVAAIYVWSNRPALLALLLSIITVGGLLSVSKAFIIGALPFVLIYWLWSQRGHRRIIALLVGVFAIGGLLQSGLFDQWSGTSYLLRLLDPTGGFFSFYSAGRFAEQSTFSTVVGNALAQSPVVGVGPAGWKVPYDGALAESLVVAGVMGLACYVAVVVAMLTLTRIGGEEGPLAFFLTAVTVAGSLGFSPLTANRVSTVIWALLALLVVVGRSRGIPAPATTNSTGARIAFRTATSPPSR